MNLENFKATCLANPGLKPFWTQFVVSFLDLMKFAIAFTLKVRGGGEPSEQEKSNIKAQLTEWRSAKDSLLAECRRLGVDVPTESDLSYQRVARLFR